MADFNSALVTGATGFIGRRLVDRLVQMGVQTRCMLRPESDAATLPREHGSINRGRLDDHAELSAAMDGMDVVFHLAGVTKSLRRQTLWDVNETITECVAAVCADQPSPPTLVLVSSLAAAGPNPMDTRLGRARVRCEDDIEQPVSDYGRSKLAGEVAARRYADRVPISIVRPPIVLGPADRDGLELVKPIAKMGIHPVPGWQAGLFSVVHVDDLVNGLVAVASRGRRCRYHAPTLSPTSEGIYFAADPQVVDYAELGRMVGRCVHGSRQVRCLRLPPAVVRVAAAANQLAGRMTGRPHIFGWDKSREALASGWACSVEKIQSECRVRFTKDLQTRLNETVSWYRNAGWI
ncbi:MAG: NAD-dependent epimerase/dehydratase family protein [Planctomycetota bacterium]